MSELELLMNLMKLLDNIYLDFSYCYVFKLVSILL